MASFEWKSLSEGDNKKSFTFNGTSLIPSDSISSLIISAYFNVKTYNNILSITPRVEITRSSVGIDLVEYTYYKMNGTANKSGEWTNFNTSVNISTNGQISGTPKTIQWGNSTINLLNYEKTETIVYGGVWKVKFIINKKVKDKQSENNTIEVELKLTDCKIKGQKEPKKYATLTYLNTNGSVYKKDTEEIPIGQTSVKFKLRDALPPGEGKINETTSVGTVTFVFDNGQKDNSTQYNKTKTGYRSFSWSGNKPGSTLSVGVGGATVQAQFKEDVQTTYGNLIVPTDPKKTGYNFDGWKPELVYEVKGPATYTAQWIAISYTALFDSNGGNQVNDKFPKYNSTFTFPSATKNSEKVSKTWTVNFYANKKSTDNTKNKDSSASSTKTGTKTFTFKGWNYKGNTYEAKDKITWKWTSNITFKANTWGENLPDLSPDAVNVPTLTNPIGYEFDGWWTKPTGGTQYTITKNKYTPAKNTTTTNMYAHWKPIDRKLVFKYYTNSDTDPISGGILRTNDTITYNIEKNITVSAPNEKDKWPYPKWKSSDIAFLGWVGGTNKGPASNKWNSTNKGVYNKPSDGPGDYKTSMTFSGTSENLKEYAQWGQDKSGKVTSTIIEYFYGCWVVSGKYVKIGTAWKQVNTVYVNIDGIWKEVSDMKIKVGNDWKKEVGM